MSTLCRISLVKKDGTVQSKQIDMDGYPSHIIPTLHVGYNTYPKILKLVDTRGMILFLGESLKPRPKKNYNDDTKFSIYTDYDEDNEDVIPPYASLGEYLLSLDTPEVYEDFQYLYYNNGWLYWKRPTDIWLISKEEDESVVVPISQFPDVQLNPSDRASSRLREFKKAEVVRIGKRTVMKELA